MSASPDNLLTINSGSSSIKTSLYRLDGGEQLVAVGQIEGIGREQGRFRMSDAAGQEHVLGFDVAVHDTLLMCVAERGRDLAEQTNRFDDRQLPGGAAERGKGLRGREGWQPCA